MTRQTDTVHTCVIQLRIYTVYMMHGCNGKIHDLQFVAKFHIAHATYRIPLTSVITHLSVRDDLRAVDGRTTGTHVDCYRVSVRLYFLTLLPYKGNMRKSASARARATALRSARRFTPPCALGQPFNSGDNRHLEFSGRLFHAIHRRINLLHFKVAGYHLEVPG